MIWEIPGDGLPGRLQQIESPPKQLFARAKDQATFDKLMQKPRIAIVGTRQVTPYGEDVTAKLAQELAAHGIVIISGLALGIDAIAHRAALDANGYTIAVLPCPVEQVHPRSHHSLAKQILENDGAIISEYAADSQLFKTNFVARNRIVAGLADALLITEAAENSGTMHTAKFAHRQGITVFAVPGNITSLTSVGTNNLLKREDVVPVTQTSDILKALGLPATKSSNRKTKRIQGTNQDEQLLIDLLERGVYDGNELLQQSQMPVEQFNHHMTMLEITAKVRALGANHWGLA